MKVQFQADADLKHVIVKAVVRREPTIDFQSAQAANLVSLDDEEVLAIAAGQNRVLVTHDRRTMPDHFAEFVAKQVSSGVIVVPQNLAVAVVVEDLILIWAASEASEWANRILSLPL
jgi:hypothetical protein